MWSLALLMCFVAELVQAPFRQELLKEMTPAVEQQQQLTGIGTLLR
jgi:hypothetical protein